MWTKRSGNFWNLTIHKAVRTLHKILYQFLMLKMSIWTQIVLTFVHLLFPKWSSQKAWCWPFAWNVPSSSDCSTEIQRHLGLNHSPNNQFPNWLLSLFPFILGRWNCGLTLCTGHCWLVMEKKTLRAITKKRYFHLCAIGTFISVVTLFEKWCQREPYSFNMYLLSTLMSWKLFKALRKENWNKINCLSLWHLHSNGANKSRYLYLYLHLNLYIYIYLCIFSTLCLCVHFTHSNKAYGVQ